LIYSSSYEASSLPSSILNAIFLNYPTGTFNTVDLNSVYVTYSYFSFKALNKDFSSIPGPPIATLCSYNSSTFKHLPKNIGSLIDPHKGLSLSSLPKKKFPSRFSNLAAIPVYAYN
jgi:hypothetical protein